MHIADGKTKIMTYKDLNNFDSIDSVLHPHGNVVLLYETRPNYGHWVCLLKHISDNGRPYLEFFDSYGMAPDQQLSFIKSRFRQENHQDYPILTELMKQSKYPVIYNKEQLQDDFNDVSTCGRHVSFRLIMRDRPLADYLRMFNKSKLSPDEIVTYLTAFQE